MSSSYSQSNVQQQHVQIEWYAVKAHGMSNAIETWTTPILELIREDFAMYSKQSEWIGYTPRSCLVKAKKLLGKSKEDEIDDSKTDVDGRFWDDSEPVPFDRSNRV